MIRIGYMGPEGTFSQQAAEEYSGDDRTHVLICFDSIPEVLYAIHDNDIDEAVVPIENSLEGAVNATLDILSGEFDLMIRAELVMSIKQNLLVKKGTAISDIRRIYSHPQPVGQCRIFLREKLPGVEYRYFESTVSAAAAVAAEDGGSAAICSASAARIYGLDIAAGDIQDSMNNFTRFAVVSHTDGIRTGSDKSSIVFSTEDKPGSLYRILDIFSLWDLNMTRIESRPAKNKLGRYIFFIDFNGHRDDNDVKDALTMIQRKTSFYKFLGSYPQFPVQD